MIILTSYKWKLHKNIEAVQKLKSSMILANLNFIIRTLLVFEPEHNKTYKVGCAPGEDYS